MVNLRQETLWGSQLGCGLTEDQVQTVADLLAERSFASGEVIFEQHEPGNSLFIVARGRVKITVSQFAGRESFVDYLTVGEHFGEMAMLTGGQRAVTMKAVMDSVLLELSQDAFEKLTEEVPALAANISRTLGFRLRRETTGQRPRNMPRVIGLVHSSRATQRLLPLLAKQLADSKETIRVLTDYEFQLDHKFVRVASVRGDLDSRAQMDWFRDQLSRQTEHEGHTLVALDVNASDQKLSNVLPQCEQVLWLAESNCVSQNGGLETLIADNADLAKRIYQVWMLESGAQPNDVPETPAATNDLDFKVVLGSPRLEAQSVSRLVRHIRGTRLGLALGGGAARGLAHLGVLRAFENRGIYFDLIAGTSAGALMALPYCYGWDLDFITETFKQDLTPGWPFSMLPKSNQWFMLYKYRSRGWERMLRNHFGSVRLQQLLIPLSIVAADLITGQEVIRDTGDAVHGVLESINLPSIAKPILREGMALVDGGIINNVPTDLLAERGADLSIGVDIARRLSQRFAKNTPNMSVEAMQDAGQFETIMRANEVQDHLITSIRTTDVDFMVSVDTSAFEFADFTRAHELADAGEQAAEEALPELQRLLDEQQHSEAVSSNRFVCPVPRRSRVR